MRKLRDVMDEWRAERGLADGTQFRFVSQEVEWVVPEVVSADEDGYRAVAYDKLTANNTENAL